jgi:hypothetical protein
MPNRNEKVLITLAAAAGIGVGTFLLIRYRKNLLTKFQKTKDLILHDFVKLPRKKFDLHIINNAEDCGKIMKIIRE